MKIELLIYCATLNKQSNNQSPLSPPKKYTDWTNKLNITDNPKQIANSLSGAKVRLAATNR